MYEISNLGRIKSLIGWNGHKYISREKILKNHIQYTNSSKTYKRFVIFLKKNKQRKMFKIHRLVAETFIPNPENRLIINHINGDSLDNRVENLEWCTQKHNLKHAYDIGLIKTKKQYNEKNIINMFNSNISPQKIIEKNNITKAIYYNVLKANNLKSKGCKYWKNKYNINLEELKKDFNNNIKNKDLAIKYKTNSNLIAKYKQKYKKGEI